jgi:hypothetical protein
LPLCVSGPADFVGDDFHASGEGLVVLGIVDADTFAILYTSTQMPQVRKYSQLPAGLAFRIAQAALL